MEFQYLPDRCGIRPLNRYTIPHQGTLMRNGETVYAADSAPIWQRWKSHGILTGFVRFSARRQKVKGGSKDCENSMEFIRIPWNSHRMYTARAGCTGYAGYTLYTRYTPYIRYVRYIEYIRYIRYSQYILHIPVYPVYPVYHAYPAYSP